MTSASPAWRVLVLSIGLLLVLTPFVQVLGQSPATTPPPSGVPYADYGLSALGSSNRVTLDALRSSTANDLTVAGFEGYIEHDLTPYGVRLVLLDIGWQNYTVGTIPEQGWVTSWLTACGALGIQNVLYVGQLTTDGVGSPWIKSAIAMDPSAQTYSSNGSAVAFISYDSADVAIYLEKDLATIYSYYGSYPSWVGIGTGSSANDPYYESGRLFPGLGYSNLSISSFVNSGYYSADVTGKGALPNGQTDPLWASYKNVQPMLPISSGQWTTSSAVNVYGNGSSSNYVKMRFQLKAGTGSLDISWYGSTVGSPGPLVIQLHADLNGSLDPAKLLGSYQVGASSFTNTTGWQAGPNIPITMTSGYYWVTFSSPTSDSNNYYGVFMKDQVTTNLTAFAQESYVGPGLMQGSPILWLKDQAGTNLAVYPYQQAVVGNSNVQTFVTNSTISFNAVFLFLSDRIFNPINGTITVADTSNDNKIVATGIVSQQLLHGLEAWSPINLNTTIRTIPGHVYSITLTEPNDGYSWIVALRGISSNPAFAGFQGQASSWLFELGYLNFVQGNLGFIDETTNGVDAITSGYLDAVRIMPSSNETLKSVSILMASNTQLSGNYTTGTLSVSIWNSNASGLVPSSPLPQKSTIPADEVPRNGWLNVTGLNQPVVGGDYYWVVFTADSNETMSLARFTNAYIFDVQVSPDGGTTWQEPREGPTEFGFVVSLTNQKVGNFVSGESAVQVSSTGYFANPFIANQTSQVSGVYLGPLVSGGLISVSINPDTGSGEPSLSPITSGIFNTRNVTLNGPQLIPFTSIAHLTAGQKYWLVVHPLAGSYNLFPIVYLPDAPSIAPNLPSIVSQDYGLTWQKVSNSSSSLVYELASQGIQLPVYNTSELAGYLSAYHNSSLAQGVIHGWTGYIAASQFSLFDQVTSWLNNDTAKDFLFYGSGQPNVLDQLPVKNEVILPTTASSTSCSGLERELTAGMPIADLQYYNVANTSFLAGCTGTAVDTVLQQLGSMLGTGSNYGQSSPTKVLVVGDAVSENLTRYLSVAYNSTYSQLSLDPSLSREGNLSGYAAIVWTSSENPSVASGSQLARYVSAGGTLIIAQFGGNESSLSSYSTSLPDSNTSLPPPGPASLTALVAHTSYANLTVSSSSTQTQGDSTDLSIIIHKYGAGEFYLVWFSGAEASQVSDPTVLLSNIIARSEALPDPFWYGLGSPLSGPALEFSVSKTGSGPILVWLANTGNQSAVFSIHLNASYYGVGSDWKALDMNDMSVSVGSGSDIVVGGNLAAGSWLPVFLVRDSSASVIDYSSVQISGQFVYPHQSFFELTAVQGQEVLLLMSSNVTASQLLVDANQSLPNLPSVGSFSNASSGWIYYNSSSTLMVKFVANGASTLRLLSYTEPVPAPTPFPTRTLLAVLIALVATELVAFTLIAFRHQRSRAPGRERGDVPAR